MSSVDRVQRDVDLLFQQLSVEQPSASAAAIQQKDTYAPAAVKNTPRGDVPILRLPPPPGLRDLSTKEIAYRVFDDGFLNRFTRLQIGTKEHKARERFCEARRAIIASMIQHTSRAFWEQMLELRRTDLGEVLFDTPGPRPFPNRRSPVLPDDPLVMSLKTLFSNKMVRPEWYLGLCLLDAQLASSPDTGSDDESDESDEVELRDAFLSRMWNSLGAAGTRRLVEFYNSELGQTYAQAMQAAQYEFDGPAWAEETVKLWKADGIA